MIGRPSAEKTRGAFVCVLLALVVALALAACGGGGSAKHTRRTVATSGSTTVDWPVVGGTQSNTRYSPLTQVNNSNVSKLGIAWDRSEGSNLSAWEDYPVVVGGTMYITTSADEVEALDAATGAVKWTYTPKVNFYLAVAGGGGGVPINRGVAVANGRVYLTTFDDQLVALQAATGEKLFETEIADPSQGYSETASPTVHGNTVYVGSAESDAGLRGFVAAYNATTGQREWRFYTVPAPGHGWVPAQGNHGGGDVWTAPTIDPATNTVYVGTGNPSPDLILSGRGGCDPHVDSVVALNASTGALKWAHTEVCPDAWDYDSHQSPMYFELTVGGKTTEAVGHANKSGIYTVLNAQTGKVISISPHLTPYTMPHPLPTTAGVDVCPGAVGGIEWSPASFDPRTQAVYQDALNICDRYVANPPQLSNIHRTGQIDFGGTFTPLTNPPLAGYLISVDPATGRVNWKDTFPKASVGGTLSTAGGLVFTGDDDGRLYGANARTGKIRWSANLGLPFGSAPMTYEIAGTQYIAVVAGGSSGIPASEGVQAGGELVVFKLGGSPVHTFPPVNPLASLHALALPNLAQFTKAAPNLYVNAAQKKAVLQVVAAATPSNSGFNFDGYAKGKANFIVPVGWTITLEFSNRSSVPHDVALTKSLQVPLTPVPPTGSIAPIAIPGPTTLAHGLSASSGTIAQGFSSNAPGRYYLVCGVPGHVQAGMWDYFTVSASAKQPSIVVK
jgi:alcohol dehydrogenase (cytochrome c)